MKISEPYPCRFVLHTSKTSKHVDLFIDTGDDFLITYELIYESFLQLPAKEDVIILRKAPHRKIYMEYQGSISNERGEIFSLKFGKIYATEFQESCFLRFLSSYILNEEERWLLQLKNKPN